MAVFNLLGENIGAFSGVASVLDYGAKGDGETNDTTAIQAALDAFKDSGGIIIFPAGTYILYNYVAFYSNQILLFEKGATLKAGNSTITALLITRCISGTTGYNGVHDSIVFGATFDGGEWETNITLAGTVHSKNVVFDSCIFKNAYGAWHDLEINSSYNCKIINCDFEGARKTTSNGCLIQLDFVSSNSNWPWADIGATDSTAAKQTEIIGCIFHDCTVAPAVGNHSASGSAEYAKIHNNIFDGLTTSRASIAFQGASNIEVYDNTFLNCTNIVSAPSNSAWTLHDNTITGATSVGTVAAKYNNFVDGTLVP